MGKIGFVFSGQGAQFPGMGKDLYEIPSGKAVFDRIEQSLPDLTRLCFSSTEDELKQTLNAQPCLYAVNLACAAVLNNEGIFADGVAGFSLGEIPALTYAGIFNQDLGVEFVLKRAQLMQACAEKRKGCMFAVLKLSVEKIEEICVDLASEGLDAFLANLNCEGQTVVSCSAEAADELKNRIANAGGRCMPLAVSGAFHSPLMQDAYEGLSDFLKDKDLGTPKVPVYFNVTGNTDGDYKTLMTEQVKKPVQWQKTIENMINDGFDTFVELGAGKVLSGLIKRISKDVAVYSATDLVGIKELGKCLQTESLS